VEPTIRRGHAGDLADLVAIINHVSTSGSSRRCAAPICTASWPA